ncbi:hypothetical protein C8J56DRAFT_964512 [Mycena floridula]|nr:hypothetical protein C8J56DRAFT_964512 [Mycena floridula]
MPSSIISLSDSEEEDFQCSQATQPPASQSEIFDLTGSDNEQQTPVPSSEGFMEIFDSDDDSHAPAPSSSQNYYRLPSLADSDDELPPAHEIVGVKRTMSTASSSNSHFEDDSASPSPPKKTRYDSNRDKPAKAAAKPRKPKKTQEERDAEKAAKQAESQRKKEARKRQTEANRELKKQEVAERKAHKDLNKLVNDKKGTLHEFQIILSKSMLSKQADLIPLLRNKMQEFQCRLIIDNDASQLPSIQWRKTVSKQYDIATRQWIACDEHTEFQPMGLLWLCAEDIDTKQLETMVTRFSQSMKSAEEKKKQIFIMIYGLGRKDPAFRTRIHKALNKLQFFHHTHHLFSETLDDAVTRLYNISADLGIKPYKLIERSHLPFCADTHQPSGKDPRDTFMKMLERISGVSESAAHGIVQAYPSIRQLMEAYQTTHDKQEMLSACKITLTKAGTARQAGHDTVKSKVSTRINTVFCGEDHLELVTRHQNGR